MHSHQFFMKQALKEAQKAMMKDEVPIGAVIVVNDQVVARGHNLREETNDPTAHAEIVAIRKLTKKKQSWRLEDAKIYVTIEPCSMCAGAILWTRMQAIVYGAKDEKGGACGTCYNLFDQKGLNHTLEIVAGVREAECRDIVQEFFKKKRSNKL